MENWITIAFSTAAFAISLLGYFRGRNIDLQNQVYLKKLDAYSSVIGEFFNLLNLLGNVRDEAERLISENNTFTNKLELNKLGAKIDLEIGKIQQEIAIKSIFFSEELIDETITYLGKLYGQIDSKMSQDPISDLNSYIVLQTQKLEDLITKMRNELGLEEMNKKLLKRIAKGKFKIDF